MCSSKGGLDCGLEVARFEAVYAEAYASSIVLVLIVWL